MQVPGRLGEHNFERRANACPNQMPTQDRAVAAAQNSVSMDRRLAIISQGKFAYQ